MDIAVDIYGARAYVIERLQRLLAGVVLPQEVASHRGQFESLDEVRRIASRSPAVRVAFRAIQEGRRDGPEFVGTVLWVVYVLANDKRGEGRSEIAGGVAMKIVDCLAEEAAHWPFAESEAQQLSAADSTTISLDKAGVALWQIAWSQSCKLQLVDLYALIGEFQGYDAKHFEPGANTGSDAPLAESKAEFPETE